MLGSSGARRPPGDDQVTDGTPPPRDPRRVSARPHGRGQVAAPRPPRHLLAQGLHPADDALPRRLRLLHVRAAAAARRARVHDRRRGARDRPRRAPPRAAPRRCSRSATSPSCATASRARSSRALGCATHDRVPRALRRPRARGDGPAPAPEPRRDEPRRARAAAAGLGLDGDHARDRLRPALTAGAGRTGLARQGAGRAAGDDPARGRARDPVHERDPDRHRRDARGAARRPARADASSATSTATSAR